MDDRDREEARLQEIRRRARELREGPDAERGGRSDKAAARGPAVSAWRPINRGRDEQREYPSYPQLLGGYPGPMAYPGMMGGYPGYAGMPTPVGMPFEGGHQVGPDPGRGRRPERERETWSPRARVHDRDGALIVRFELPGLEREDVEVRVEDQMLVVEGERQDDRPDDGGLTRRSGWGYGHFRREVALPHPVDASDVKAHFRNGVLEVEVPQPRREERRIPVKISA